MKTISVSIEKFKKILSCREFPWIETVIIFGSASYNDFITGYSDLDIFISMDVLTPEEVLERLTGLKVFVKDAFTIKNIDYTVIRKEELHHRRQLTLNPFIYEEIRLGLLVHGPPLPNRYSNDELRQDSLYVAAMGLRGLRAMMESIYIVKPMMVLRRCDELLFKSTKALLTHLTGIIHSSKAQTFNCLKNWVKKTDISIYEKLMEMRNRLKHHKEISIKDYDKIFLESLITFEKIWGEILK